MGQYTPKYRNLKVFYAKKKVDFTTKIQDTHSVYVLVIM